MDIYTLVVAIATINAVFAVVYYITFLKLRNLQYILFWAVSCTLFALNAQFYLNEHWLPPVVFHLGSGLFILSGICVRLLAARNFGGREVSCKHVLIPCLAIVFLSAPFLIQGDYGAATTIYYFAFAIVGLLATWEYARDIPDGLVSRYGVVFCYGMVAATFGYRAFLGLFVDPVFGQYGLPAGEIQATRQHILLIGSSASAALCLALAFEKAMQEQQIAALEDHLTGIMNRRAFELASEKLFDSAQHRSFAIAHADLDHFKKINDRFGHEGGDRALVHFTKQVRQHLGPRDLFARFGGEEFVFLLPDRSQQETAELLDRIRRHVSDNTLQLPEGSCPLSVSFGYTIGHATDDSTITQVMRLSDTALYRAKKSGRNRVCYEPETRDQPISAMA